MAGTPEGKTKARLDKLLNSYRPHLAYRKPVQNGMGQPTLDYYGCIYGLFFMIEAKAGYVDLTPVQKKTRREFRAAGGKIMSMHDHTDDASLAKIKRWLDIVVAEFQAGS